MKKSNETLRKYTVCVDHNNKYIPLQNLPNGIDEKTDQCDLHIREKVEANDLIEILGFITEVTKKQTVNLALEKFNATILKESDYSRIKWKKNESGADVNIYGKFSEEARKRMNDKRYSNLKGVFKEQPLSAKEVSKSMPVVTGSVKKDEEIDPWEQFYTKQIFKARSGNNQKGKVTSRQPSETVKQSHVAEKSKDEFDFEIKYENADSFEMESIKVAALPEKSEKLFDNYSNPVVKIELKFLDDEDLQKKLNKLDESFGKLKEKNIEVNDEVYWEKEPTAWNVELDLVEDEPNPRSHCLTARWEDVNSGVAAAFKKECAGKIRKEEARLTETKAKAVEDLRLAKSTLDGLKDKGVKLREKSRVIKTEMGEMRQKVAKLATKGTDVKCPGIVKPTLEVASHYKGYSLYLENRWDEVGSVKNNFASYLNVGRDVTVSSAQGFLSELDKSINGYEKYIEKKMSLFKKVLGRGARENNSKIMREFVSDARKIENNISSEEGYRYLLAIAKERVARCKGKFQAELAQFISLSEAISKEKSKLIDKTKSVRDYNQAKTDLAKKGTDERYTEEQLSKINARLQGAKGSVERNKQRFEECNEAVDIELKSYPDRSGVDKVLSRTPVKQEEELDWAKEKLEWAKEKVRYGRFFTEERKLLEDEPVNGSNLKAKKDGEYNPIEERYGLNLEIV